MIDYPQAHALHTASKLDSPEEVERYRGDGGRENVRLCIPEQIYRRRGSIRDFSHEPISHDDLAAILDGAIGAIPLDVRP
jgi:hypothetical protein